VKTLRCVDCGRILWQGGDQEPAGKAAQENPCPVCGGRAGVEVTVPAGVVMVSAPAPEVKLSYLANEVRLAVFLALVAAALGVGLTVGLDVNSAWWAIASAAGTFVAGCLLVALVARVDVVRGAVMRVMHWITGL
jgi:hypothetical protein